MEAPGIKGPIPPPEFHSLSSSQALVCSSFIPGFFGLIPPTFRGVVSLLWYPVCIAPALEV